IEDNLGEALDLDTLAEVAAFSKYHFHRLFSAMMGETIGEYVLRQRLQKAARAFATMPGRSVTGIAHECGFSASAVFAKSFKARFGMSATEWRKAKSLGLASADVEGDEGKAPVPRMMPGFPGARLAVDVVRVPVMTLAYLRYVGSQKGKVLQIGSLFNRLIAWIGSKNLSLPEKAKTVFIYHEDPEMTPDPLLRMSIGFTVPAGTSGEGEICVARFDPGLCAVARFACADDEYQAAWNWIYGAWLPGSGFAPNDTPPFELYGKDARDPVTGKTFVEICVPIGPMADPRA
ncbi:MAG: AraC family transcriptional regulator, partial [Spirochaetaceae bacterium]|nr:AraC family transcriptional regulator [Spirochaetaceae bacterium]